MDTNAEPISVTILDRDYQFACQPEERKALRKAAEHLDERMRAVKAEGRLMTLERIAMMTALNLADELLRMQEYKKHRQQNVDSRIRMLADELDDALDD
jgi:cell division protein ZapA